MIKQITLFAFALFTCVILSAQVTFEEDFTGKTGPTGIGSATDIGWKLYNVDGSSPNAQVNYIQEAWQIVNFVDYEEVLATTSWFTSGAQADRWAVTPEIEVPEGNPALLYSILSIDPSSPEAYEILVSTTGNAPENFTDAPIFTENPAPSSPDGDELLNQRLVSLEDYAGENVHIAFRSIGKNGYLLFLDNIIVSNLQDDNVEVAGINITKYIPTNTEIPIKVNIKNAGGNTIESLTIEWTDGEETFSDEYTGLDIAVNKSMEIELSETFSSSTLDEKTITVTATKVNGNDDPQPADNEATAIVNMVSQLVDKAVVIEEGTGTWCGWCPRGIVAMEYMYDHPDLFPNFIGIAVHNGDPMVNTEYDNRAGITGFPGANIDRVIMGGGVGQTEWKNYYNQRAEIVAPAELEMSLAYDKSSREMVATVNSTFYSNFSNANFRIGLVVVEDGVTGTGGGWNQANYYAGGGSGPLDGWESLPSSVGGIAYDRVGRALIGGYDGEAGSVPNEITDGSSYSYEVNYTIPEEYDAKEVSIVALLIDQETGAIVNGTEASLAELGIDTPIAKNFTIYPNPATDVINVEFTSELTGDALMNVYDLTGRVVKSQTFRSITSGESLQINVDDLASGEYLLSFSTAQGTQVKKLVIK